MDGNITQEVDMPILKELRTLLDEAKIFVRGLHASLGLHRSGDRGEATFLRERHGQGRHA